MKIWKLPSLFRRVGLNKKQSTAPQTQTKSQNGCRLYSYPDKSDWVKFESGKEPEEKKPRNAGLQASKDSSAEGTDLDFSVLQSSQQLNVDVTKQRITLRQKGSLARRRKPTRPSVRTLNDPELTLFTDSTEPRQMSMDADSEDEEENQVQVQRLTVQQHAPTHSTEQDNLPTHTAPVLLPGLADHIKKRTMGPVPLPKPAIQAKPSSETSPPPWMAEVKARRGSRPLDLERIQPEPRNSESPSWMRDALNKKKRAADLIERRTAPHVETEQPSVPPWMKELRHTPRSIPSPIVNPTNNNRPSTEAPLSPAPFPDKVANLNETNTPRQDLIISPFTNGNLSETRSKGREVLAPIKRSSVDNSTHPPVIDTRLTTPPYRGTSNAQLSEITPNKSVLPPLKSTTQSSSSQDNQENSASPVPAWRKELAARRKSKTFVPVVKPEVPLKLGETPTWKRELAERNKLKKRDSVDLTSAPSPTPPSSATASPTLMPWQQELAQRRKRAPSITRQPTDSNSGKEEPPPWAKNVELRRARLADRGLINHLIDESSG